MKLARHQKGLTAISWLFILALVALVALFVLKVGMAYAEDFSITTSMKSLNEEASGYAGPAEIKETIERRFKMNNVSNASTDDLIVEASNGGYRVTLAYEVRKNFIGNVDLVTSFEHVVEVRSR